MRKDRHHLLEIILWPKADGTFRTILNTKERLKELGIYNDYKMTIPLTKSEHMKLHGENQSDEHKKENSEANKGRKLSAESRKKMSEAKKGEKHPLYGKTHSAETKRKMSNSRKGKHWKLSEETKKKMSEARKAVWQRRKSTKYK